MKNRTVVAVQSSWNAVEPIAPQAAALFYQNLFEADPSLQPLFHGNMEEQGKKLMQMISTAVGKLNDPNTLIPILQNMGKRHVAYGVTDQHYQTVGNALLKTLEQGLGPAFTPQMKDAWTKVYSAMSSVMISAAKN